MVLFLCSQARLRSRTAELLCLFGGLDARSAGTDHDALVPASDGLLRSADLIVCMQPVHAIAISHRPHASAASVVTLGIPDTFNRLEPALVNRLVSRMREHSPEIADAMQRGADVLGSLPGYREALGTHSPAFSTPADNPAFRATRSTSTKG